MTPEEQIRQLMEENARLKAQLDNPYAAVAPSREYQDWQHQQQTDALRKEFADYQKFHKSPNMFMRKEPRRKPIGLDGY